MNRREFAVGALALPALWRPAAAQVTAIRLGKQYGLPFLPQMVMEAQKLIEKHAAQRGISLGVEWLTMSGPGTRNAAVTTIADFTPNDRIAVPTVKISGQAMALQMAAAKLWGAEHYERLDSLTVSMAHPDALQALLSGRSEITTHFAVSPFHYYELATPGIRQVLKSYDTLGGRHTNGIQVTTKRFYEANPKICAAVLAAHQEANAFINAQPRSAAEIYLSLTRDRRNSLDDLARMVTDPDVEYTTTPANVTTLVAFMHKAGRIKRLPGSWKDLFFPDVHGVAGS